MPYNYLLIDYIGCYIIFITIIIIIIIIVDFTRKPECAMSHIDITQANVGHSVVIVISVQITTYCELQC